MEAFIHALCYLQLQRFCLHTARQNRGRSSDRPFWFLGDLCFALFESGYQNDMMLRSEASLWHEINGDKETACWKTFDTALIRALCYARATSNESRVKSARTAIMHAYTQSATKAQQISSRRR